jgi:hypothetical protein
MRINHHIDHNDEAALIQVARSQCVFITELHIWHRSDKYDNIIHFTASGVTLSNERALLGIIDGNANCFAINPCIERII